MVLAAGGVLWRGDPADPEVALVHRPAYDDWSLPKGKSKRGEHVLITALREVAEETGYRSRVGPYLTASRYPVTVGRKSVDKVVRYWAMREAGGEFQPTREVDGVRWLGLEEARRTVDPARDGRVLEAFARAPLDTLPFILVRHGPTAKGRAGRGHERAQPVLARSGRAQAQTLVPVLSGVGAGQLLAADLAPCSEMLEPYAVATGLELEREARLTAAAFKGNELGMATELRERAARTTDGALVVCGQRRVVAGVVASLGRASGHRAPEPLAVEKGGWWLLHHRQGDVLAFERHAPAA